MKNKIIEQELTNLSGQTFSDHKEYRTYIKKAFQRIWDKGIKEPHNTEEGYCCACEYDVAVFEGRLREQKEEILEEVEDIMGDTLSADTPIYHREVDEMYHKLEKL